MLNSRLSTKCVIYSKQFQHQLFNVLSLPRLTVTEFKFSFIQMEASLDGKNFSIPGNLKPGGSSEF